MKQIPPGQCNLLQCSKNQKKKNNFFFKSETEIGTCLGSSMLKDPYQMVSRLHRWQFSMHLYNNNNDQQFFYIIGVLQDNWVNLYWKKILVFSQDKQKQKKNFHKLVIFPNSMEKQTHIIVTFPSFLNELCICSTLLKF